MTTTISYPTTSAAWENEPVIFLNRENRLVNFTRNWEDYKRGFGDREGDFWLGLDELHNLTNSRNYSLLVDFKNTSNQTIYNKFYVGPESDGYRLTVTGYDKGRKGVNVLFRHDKMKFSTYDRDNDISKKGNCALKHKGGFWYDNCYTTNPTGADRDLDFYKTWRYTLI